ncbi:MAG TPA: lysylphosphatidylglycerol synthase transmembrane domain-containing protein [Gemmatimonadales bacterium]|nr:lysylphosphatidylglycerol synthase transmembrane domain-containing protein [Gemmatimonadales bacterium]
MADSSPSTPAVPGSNHRWWQTLLAVAISAAFLYWALKGIHFSEVVAELKRVNLLPLVACVAIATSTFVLRIFRWRILLRAEDGGPLPLGALWHAIAIGFMANNVLPFRAGELLRSIAITRLTRTRLTSAISSIAAERLFDGIALVLILTTGLLLSGLPASAAVKGVRVSHIALIAGATFVAGLVLAGLVVAFPRPAERLILKLVPFKKLADRLVAMIEGVVHGLSVVRSPVRVIAVLAWSVLIWLVSVSSFFVAFKAFGIPINFAGAMLMQGLLAFAISVPTAPGFVGVFEGAIKATLLLYGLSDNVAVTYALVYHATTFVPITLLGAYSLFRTGLGLKNLRQEATAA